MKELHYTDCKERVCPQCGKTFIVPPENVYKEFVGRKEKDFCSWNCLCRWRKEHEKKYKIGGGKPVAIVKADTNFDIIKKYRKIVDAARENNVSSDYIKARLETGRIDARNNCYWAYDDESIGEDDE